MCGMFSGHGVGLFLAVLATTALSGEPFEHRVRVRGPTAAGLGDPALGLERDEPGDQLLAHRARQCCRVREDRHLGHFEASFTSRRAVAA